MKSRRFTNIWTWARTRDCALKAGFLECDKSEFWSHWRSRGKKDKGIVKRWAKTTTPERFKNGDMLVCWEEGEEASS